MFHGISPTYVLLGLCVNMYCEKRQAITVNARARTPLTRPCLNEAATQYISVETHSELAS